MKKLIIFLLTTSILYCKFHQPIIPLYNGSDYLETQNAYYKDVDGDLEKLIGTWKYTNGNENFEIELKIKTKNFTEFPVTNFSCFEDILYGELKYFNQNGVEILNTLNQIDLSNDPYEHSIYGNYIKNIYDLPICDDCDADERRVVLVIEDPERDYFDYDMIIRHFPNDSFGQLDHIVLTIILSDSAIVPEGASEEDRLPLYRELTLYKQ